MIFATAANEPAVFLMLSEDDVVQMREGQCVSCKGIMAPSSLFEEKCIFCWATQAKKGGGA